MTEALDNKKQETVIEKLVSQYTRPYTAPVYTGKYPHKWIHQLACAPQDWIGRKVHLRGRAVEVTDMKKRTFIILGQGDLDRVSIVYEKKAAAETTNTADNKKGDKLTPQSWIHVDGEVRALPAGKFNKFNKSLPIEIIAESIVIRSLAKEDYPNRCPSDADAHKQLALRHLSIRDPTFAVEQELCHMLVTCLEETMQASGCSKVSPPSFTSMPCEGGADLFHLDAPGISKDKPMRVDLVQSAQLYLEFSIASRGLAGVYCNAKSFRAEHSHTRRHLLEFDHFEAEWNDVTTIEEHAQKLVDMLRDCMTRWIGVGKSRLEFLGKYDSAVKKLAMLDDIVFLHHRDAIKMLNELGIKKEMREEVAQPAPENDGMCTVPEKKYNTKLVPFEEMDDIPEAQERKLIDTICKIVLLWGFHKSFKSFYMGKDKQDPERVLGIDLEVPGVGEIIGSGIREQTVQGLKEQGISDKEYGAYFDTREYGFSFTSGMGLGIGRLMTWLLDEESIRKVTEYPRFPGYAAP